MEYSVEQIIKFADQHIDQLMNDEYVVESLPNSEYLYHGYLEEEYSQAVRNANPDSRLFKATYEE